MAKKQQKGPRSSQKQLPKRQVQTVVKYVDRPVKPKDSVLGQIGRLAGNGISKFFGMGAYQLKSNSVWDNVAKQVPFMHSMDDTFRIRHREFIGDVSSSVGFVNTRYSVNPGDAIMFPYLSSVAQAFSEYKFDGLVFEFKSTSASALNSTNTALGTMALSAAYDVSAPAPITKQQVLSSMWSADGKPCEDVFLPIECAPSQRPQEWYLVNQLNTSTGDQHFYDWCNFDVSSVGSQAVAVVGELWATYDVVLAKPRPTLGQLASFRFNNPDFLYTGTMGAGFALTDSTARYTLDYSIPAGTITIPPNVGKTFRIQHWMTGSVAASPFQPPAMTVTNGTIAENLYAPELTAAAYYINATRTYTITDPAKPCVITHIAMASGNYPTGTKGGVVYIIVWG